MNVSSQLTTRWRQLRQGADAAWKRQAPAWFVSLLVHMGLLVALALISTVLPHSAEFLTLEVDPVAEENPLAATDQFSYSEVPQDEIGAPSLGTADATFNSAPTLDLAATMPAREEVEVQPYVTERMEIQKELQFATGPKFSENLSIKGVAGVGATGTVGAVDRITQEILSLLEERRTLVVWLFDQSGSLAAQRADINKRFDRIYEELGVIEAQGNPAFKKHDNKPLLSAVVSFGQTITFLTPKPTDDVKDIKAKVAGIKTDDSGIERTFEAVCEAAERFRQYRAQEPRRNVMFVIFSDEAGDDETVSLDRAVTICSRLAIPVNCVGVPAPFGRRDALIKYVDPDPKYDQTPQWVPVRQGPESCQPELVKIGMEQEDEPMDSGFGPYSLTRLCHETGGIFFAVHPNRDQNRVVSRRETAVLSAQLNRFFDPEIMRNYQPEYVSIKEYQRLLNENKARAALVQAAQMSWVTPMQRPQLNFPKVNDADLANKLTQAQQAAAVLEPKLDLLYDTLRQGENDRARLTKPRWQAGYDLSMGRVLAVRVRTKGYNAILAKAKQGMRFEDPKHDTWQLTPAGETSVSSELEKMAAQAKMYLERVVREHAKTPWALLAEEELKQPLGWKWREIYTGVNEPPRQVTANNNNNNPRTPQNEKAKMIPRPVKRPAPKL